MIHHRVKHADGNSQESPILLIPYPASDHGDAGKGHEDQAGGQAGECHDVRAIEL